MRFKDFGEATTTVLSKDLITVSSTVPTESQEIRNLEVKNREYLRPWRIPMNMDSSSAKIFTVKYSGTVVGQIILFNFQVNDGLKSCSISYWIDEDFSSMGITTSAVELVISHAYQELGVDEVDATIQPENAPSIRVIEKLKYESRDIIGEGRVVDGRWQNYTLYTVTRKLKNADV